jgi:hypothetical protein
VTVAYGLYHFSSQPDFWKNFVPSMLANIVGVGIGAIIGVPVGLGINHLVAKLGEERHHQHQVAEVRQLLEQVRTELSVHLTRLTQIAALFPLGEASLQAPQIVPSPTMQSNPPTAPQLLAADVIPLQIPETAGQQLIGNRSILEIGEMQALFHVSNYYARVSEMNRLIAWRAQDQMHPGGWDRKISDLAYSLSSTRAQLDYDLQQVIAKLNG